MKPGKPVAFGVRRDHLVFNLPGNPVSVLATFELLVRPAVNALLGLPSPLPAFRRGTLAAGVRRNADRDEFVRATVAENGGEPVLDPVPGQESHMIVRTGRAAALAWIPAGEGEPRRRSSPLPAALAGGGQRVGLALARPSHPKPRVDDPSAPRPLVEGWQAQRASMRRVAIADRNARVVVVHDLVLEDAVAEGFVYAFEARRHCRCRCRRCGVNGARSSRRCPATLILFPRPGLLRSFRCGRGRARFCAPARRPWQQRRPRLLHSTES